MKISLSWLKSIIPSRHSAQEISDLLTGAGLEVEAIEEVESVPGGLKGLVVGEVLECAKHPDADRLSVTKVDIGAGAPLGIVCGAPNVAAGQKVIVATPGTRLFPVDGEPFEIRKSKIRGVASEGMICAEDEIGVGKSHAGIMVLPAETRVGMAAADYFKCESDTVLEIGLTPNRNDAASHLGVARDLAAILNSTQGEEKYRLNLEGIGELPEPDNEVTVDIRVTDARACPRYSALVITGVTVGESPAWLKNRLKSIGLRPVNNIVDITNFVLHELGQPLHAFDLGSIQGNQVIVRSAKEGETFKTLDGVERVLRATDLMICNKNEPMCIAGVFGGADSGVSESTRAIFLESAFFDAASVRRTARHHALRTDASFRFERGTDPEMTVTALKRAAHLVLELAGGSLSMGVTDIYPEKLEPRKVAFSYRNCSDLIGKEMDRATVKNIIHQLDIEIESEGSDGLLLMVPRYRNDVTREADVIEEVMRIYGYNHVEVSRHISWTAFNAPVNYAIRAEEKAGNLLEGLGFHEIMSLSLTREAYNSGEETAVKLLNPLSADLDVLRTDMVFSGLEAIAHNINRKNNALKLFETGKTYRLSANEKERYTEQKHLALFATGPLFRENPYGLSQQADFSYLKSVLDVLFEKLGIKQFKDVPSSYKGFSYGLSRLLNNKAVAELGSVSAAWLRKFEIRQPVYYAVVNWDLLVKAFSRQKVEFEEISKFPAVRRDLALLLDKSVSYSQVEELAFATEKKLLREVNLFDIYEDEKLGNKRSYAVSFTLLDKEATLTDKQIDGVMLKLISNYREKLGAELR